MNEHNTILDSTINRLQSSSKVTESNILFAKKARNTHAPAASQDILVSMASEGVQASKPEQGPTLPGFKSGNLSLSSFLNDKSPSIISIIGQVMTLQAKTNSSFWSTIWQQASQSMQMAADFAPIMAKATIENYNAQSDATKAEADMAMQDGIASLIAGVFCLAGGVISVAREGVGVGEDIAAKNVTDDAKLLEPKIKPPEPAEGEGEGEGEGIKPAEENSALNTTKSAQDDVSNALKNEDKSLTGKIKRGWAALKSCKVALGFVKAISAAASSAALADMGNKAFTGIFVDSPKKCIISEQQKLSGEAQAVNEMSQQYAQYYTQDFNRQEDLRQGSQQNIDYAMQILKSASDTITQTVQSMFRG